jgi:eukaryotic-like serine/threonine-protein kinase
VLKAMAKAPAERYQNAEEMRADLRRAMSGVPVSPPPAEMPPLTRGPGGPVVAAPPDTAIRGCGDGAGPPPGHRRRRTVLWVVAGVLVLAAVIATGYLMLAGGGSSSGSGGPTYPVPDVRGLTSQQAGQKITANHLRPHLLRQSSPSVPKGQVISTRPAAGTVVAAGSTVTVFVSVGQHQRPVPDVRGEGVAAARATIAGAGLNPVVKTDTTSAAPADTVVRQSPAPGTPLSPGSDVTVYISAGGTTSGGGTVVRDVTGDPAAMAKTILQGQGFKVTQVKRPGLASALAGTVYAQHPAGGTLLAPGSTVTIYVQPAPPPVIVPAPAALSVAQGSAGTFGVALSAAPTSTVTVTVDFTSGNSGLSVTSGGTLTFTPSDWNIAQGVTITADSSSTGTATFTATAPGHAQAAITVTETPAAGGNGQGANRGAWVYEHPVG